MVRNGPIVPRQGKHRRLWPFGKSGNKRRAEAMAAAAAQVEPPAPARAVARKPPPPPPPPARKSEAEAQFVASRSERIARSRSQKIWLAAKLSGAAGLLIGLGLGSHLLYRAILHSPHFVVREVRITPTVHVSTQTLRERAAIAIGSNLMAVDLAAATRQLQADPWVRSARVRRELPGAIAIEIVERQPACILALGSLYVADAQGQVFKRATPEEAAELPIVSGVPRDAYVDDRDVAQAMVREALVALSVWREKASRPAIGEVHIDAVSGVTLYTVKEGVAVRIGNADGASQAEEWRERLARYDAVAAALREVGEQPRFILVDQRKRPDRVTVKLASR